MSTQVFSHFPAEFKLCQVSFLVQAAFPVTIWTLCGGKESEHSRMQNACQLENKWPAAEDSYVFSPDLAWGRKQLDRTSAVSRMFLPVQIHMVALERLLEKWNAVVGNLETLLEGLVPNIRRAEACSACFNWPLRSDHHHNVLLLALWWVFSELEECTVKSCLEPVLLDPAECFLCQSSVWKGRCIPTWAC